MKKPTGKQTWAGVAIIALPIISAALGIKYEQAQIPAPEVTTNVAITALPPGATRSAQEVKALAKEIAEELMKEHEKGGKYHG